MKTKTAKNFKGLVNLLYAKQYEQCVKKILTNKDGWSKIYGFKNTLKKFDKSVRTE